MRVYLTPRQIEALAHHCPALAGDQSFAGRKPEERTENYIEITDGGCLGVNGAYLHDDGEWATFEQVRRPQSFEELVDVERAAVRGHVSEPFGIHEEKLYGGTD